MDGPGNPAGSRTEWGKEDGLCNPTTAKRCLVLTELELTQSVLSSYQEEAKKLDDTWRLLETKAQGTTAVVGVFIAAVFAIARSLPAGLSAGYRGLLVASVALLVASVLLSVAALRVRSVIAHPGGAVTRKLVLDYLGVRTADDAEERYVRSLHDQCVLWENATRTHLSANRSKARLLLMAQLCLVAATVVFASLTVWSIVSV